MNSLKRFTLGLVASALFLPVTATPPAMAEGGVQIGVLSCNSVPGTQRDLLVHSTVGVTCVFDGPGGQERYKGSTGIGLGVDLNWNRDQTIHFAVLGGATDTRIGSHALAGKYFGGKASATFLVGGGAGALIGAGPKTISLQPLALEGSTGWGLAGGLGYLYLEAD
ncbi:MAG: DUF992 domain-containing protein [Rhodospirillales bacterium]|nr:DUF992 domain-containing protein [Rhodospirillales bacterium]